MVRSPYKLSFSLEYAILTFLFFIGFEIVSTEKFLKLSISTRKDAGSYTCKADNEIGSIEHKIHLAVNGNK